METFSTKNIVQRLKKAMDKLAKCDEDLISLKEQMGEHNWNKFTSYAAGFISSSLLNDKEENE